MERSTSPSFYNGHEIKNRPVCVRVLRLATSLFISLSHSANVNTHTFMWCQLPPVEIHGDARANLRKKSEKPSSQEAVFKYPTHVISSLSSVIDALGWVAARVKLLRCIEDP